MKIPRIPNGLSAAVSDALLPWFGREARDLPWRRDRSPYRVWISEAMLQQTRVETVIPYFERWMRRFPDLESLAAAGQEEVLKAWEGLGYYARARNLHKAARAILRSHGGRIPADPKRLAELPGIGPYTLAAVGSLAFGLPLPVLDGNVERVLTRLLAWDRPLGDTGVKDALRNLAGRLMADHPPGEFNEAMMELGATVCLPSKPACPLCPLKAACRGRRGDPARFPVKRPKAKIPTLDVAAAVTWRDAETFLIARRHEKGLLGGMWEFPGGKREEGKSDKACVVRELKEELDITVEPIALCAAVKHSYTHFHLRMRVYHCRWSGGAPRTADCADFRWVRLEDCAALPFGKADRMVLNILRQSSSSPEFPCLQACQTAKVPQG